MKDLKGKTFGRLTVLEATDQRIDGKVVWKCKCSCGTEEVYVQGTSLTNKSTGSCGCLRREVSALRSYVHGGVHSRLYSIWQTMKTRTTNQNCKDWKYYGARGIAICDEWLHDFAAFRDWALANGYSDELTIDRKENDEGYSPENCRWATYKEQRLNQRRMKIGTKEGAAPLQRTRPQAKQAKKIILINTPAVKQRSEIYAYG